MEKAYTMAEEPYTRIYARIDLDAIVKNMEAMRENLPVKTKMIGVVKTDGYGHGAVPVAKTIAPFVWGYAVATLKDRTCAATALTNRFWCLAARTRAISRN